MQQTNNNSQPNEMNDFLELLQKESVANYNENMNTKKVQNQARDERMKAVMNNLTDQIMNGAKEKMLSASKNGLFQTPLYEFSIGDSYNDEFKTIFLFKGPIRWTKDVGFFEEKGIDTINNRIANLLNPINTFCRYDRSDSKHRVYASWKTNR